jgi:hypothetical protein
MPAYRPLLERALIPVCGVFGKSSRLATARAPRKELREGPDRYAPAQSSSIARRSVAARAPRPNHRPWNRRAPSGLPLRSACSFFEQRIHRPVRGLAALKLERNRDRDRLPCASTRGSTSSVVGWSFRVLSAAISHRRGLAPPVAADGSSRTQTPGQEKLLALQTGPATGCAATPPCGSGDLEEMGILRVESRSGNSRTFALTMRGRREAEALDEQYLSPRPGGGRAPSARDVLRWLVDVARDEPACFDIPERLLDRAVNEGIIEIGGRDALAQRIIGLSEQGYLRGEIRDLTFGSCEHRLARTTRLEVTVAAENAVEPPQVIGSGLTLIGSVIGQVAGGDVNNSSRSTTCSTVPIRRSTRSRGSTRTRRRRRRG